MRLALEADVRLRAPLPPGPKILAANHPTTSDPFYLLTLLDEPVSVLVASGIFRAPVFGPYLRAAGHTPAVRESGGATVDALVRQVECGRSVAIFPEGALSPSDGGCHRPHTGVARVALRTGAPVIPIGIGLLRDRIKVIEAGAARGKHAIRYYGGGPYAITVGRPLYFGGSAQNRQHVRDVANAVMAQIRNLAMASDRRITPRPKAMTGTATAKAGLAGANRVRA
jgi:1-acyl-sn-glycerol-3-phosphate acyltransferase